MLTNEPVNNAQDPEPTPKRRKHGGKPARITTETVLRVAERVVSGVPLKYACALENPPVSLARWQAKLSASPRLAALFDTKIGQGIEAMLQKVKAAECLRKMPPEVWLLERRFKEYFGQQREQNNVTINQTVIGLSDGVLRRARAALLKVGKPAPIGIERKAIADGAE